MPATQKVSWDQNLKKVLGRRLHQNYSLASRTTLGIGGRAQYFAELQTQDEMALACRWAKLGGLPLTVLGFGSNVLISDQGLPGLVLTLEGHFKRIVLDKRGFIHAGAAARLPQLATFAAAHGFCGMEFLTGIPGTVGGGLYMNAGIKGSAISGALSRVRLFNAARGKFFLKKASEIEFAYRYSSFQDGPDIIAEGIFKYPLAKSRQDVLKTIREHMARRKQTQPVSTNNAGSIFKNPQGDYAARLIEAAGLKGMRVGGAQISTLHANFIVNTGGARAAHVFSLMSLAQRRVQEKFGARLESEIKLLGAF